jgi:3-oxoacyl-[acyl-carrier-protein] synthase III
MSKIIERYVKISGTGSYLPKNVLTDFDLDKMGNLKPGVSRKVTGAERRFYVNGESASYMAAEASRQALKVAGLKPSDIEIIVSTAGVNEQPIPTGSCLVAEQLELHGKGIPCLDINSSCMSFLEGLNQISYQVHLGVYETALICSSDITSRGLNYKDVMSYPLFSDGSGAIVLTKDKTKKSKIISYHHETYPEAAHYSEIIGGGNKIPPTDITEENRDLFKYSLKGQDMSKFGKKVLPDFFERAYGKIGKSLKDVVEEVVAIIPHQVSTPFNNILKEILDAPSEKFWDLTRRYGNMLAASIPFTLDKAIKLKKIKRGDKIMIWGGGSGISLGTMLLKY